MSLMEVEDVFSLNVWSMRTLAYSVSVLSITFAQTSLFLYQSKASSQLPQKPCICFLKHITKHKGGHQVTQEVCN